MKNLTTLTLGLVLTASSLTAAAGSSDRDKLALCDSHVNEALGEGTRTKLYGIKHRRGGDSLRLKAYPNDGDSLVVNCWVDDEGTVSLQTSDGVALGAPSHDGAERVSLSE